MGASQRGPVGVDGIPDSVKDGKTSTLSLTPAPFALGTQYIGDDDSLSFELSDAPFVCVPTVLSHVSLAEMRVLAWLRNHKTEIITAEADFHVDRRAIAGAIAWEALPDDKWYTNLAHYVGASRAVGPGKVHLRLNFFSNTTEGTWAYKVEQEGLLPKKSDPERKVSLETPHGAIRYIAAAMDLIAIIYEGAGSKGISNPSLRNNPYILTNVYQGSNPEKWTERVKHFSPDQRLEPGNDMPLWLLDPRNMALVEDGVGRPEKSLEPQLRDVTAVEGASILQNAKAYLNVPYSWGGGTMAGIDCSHLVYRAILGAFPQSGFEYADVHDLASSPNLRSLGNGEQPRTGDIVLYSGHVGIYDATPPANKAGETLFSARGDKNRSTPGVTWGNPTWFGSVTGYFRVRVN